MSTMTLGEFDGSTCVRTVRLLLAEKGFGDDEQAPPNVRAGEPRRSCSTGR